MEPKQYLYRLTFPNGMVYIGSTHDVKDRWAGNGAHYKGMAVGDAIEKFGWDNVKKEVIVQVPPSWANEDTIKTLEKYMIKAYDSRCYNVTGTKAHRMRMKGARHKERIMWDIGGVTKPATDWCAEYGVSYSLTLERLRKYDIDKVTAMSLPRVPSGMTRRSIEYWNALGYEVRKK